MNPASHSNSFTPWRRWVLLGVAVVLLIVGVQYTLKASDDRSAFVRWKDQLRDLAAGVDVYDQHNYPNPPIMGLILYPLSLLPELSIGYQDLDLGALAWFCVKVGLTVVAFLWAVQIIQQRNQPFPPWAQTVMLVLSLRPLVGDLSHGNVNLLILFLVIASLYAFHRGRDVTAGLVLALAIACKVTPALFIPYFLWKRAWKTLAGCAAGLVLFLGVVPGSLLGFQHNLALHASWYEKMVQP
jgi:hypothetical protein